MPVKRSGGNPSGAPKRTRFASPPPPERRAARGVSSGASSERDGDVDDQFLDTDITESSRSAKKRERRALRDQDGYGSDSSNDEESVVPSRRPGAKDDDGDDEMDMFAEEPEDKGGKGKEKVEDKTKEFMDMEDVEGQEFGDADDDRDLDRRIKVDDDDSDIEEEGLTDAEKRKKAKEADLGIEITPFNVKQEMEDGRFTDKGEAYIENARDPGEKHDAWLTNLDTDEIKKARRAHRERERLEREREQHEAEIEGGAETEQREHGLMRSAIDLMERGETVLEALQRLGKDVEDKRKKDDKEAAASGKKKSWAERQRERKAAQAQEEADPEHAGPFTKLSNIVSGLTAIGHLDVYSLSREAIQRMLPREPEAARPPPAPRPPPDTRQFQYRFSLAYVRNLPEAQRPVEREVFGPFSVQQLGQWKATGFFGRDCENIELRVVGTEPWGSWTDVVEKGTRS